MNIARTPLRVAIGSTAQFAMRVEVELSPQEIDAVTSWNLWGTVMLNPVTEGQKWGFVSNGIPASYTFEYTNEAESRGREINQEKTLKDLVNGVILLEGAKPGLAETTVRALETRLHSLAPYLIGQRGSRQRINADPAEQPIPPRQFRNANPLDPQASKPLGKSTFLSTCLLLLLRLCAASTVVLAVLFGMRWVEPSDGADNVQLLITVMKLFAPPLAAVAVYGIVSRVLGKTMGLDEDASKGGSFWDAVMAAFGGVFFGLLLLCPVLGLPVFAAGPGMDKYEWARGILAVMGSTPSQVVLRVAIGSAVAVAILFPIAGVLGASRVREASAGPVRQRQ